jgi:hypothetical protein
MYPFSSADRHRGVTPRFVRPVGFLALTSKQATPWRLETGTELSPPLLAVLNAPWRRPSASVPTVSNGAGRRLCVGPRDCSHEKILNPANQVLGGLP